MADFSLCKGDDPDTKEREAFEEPSGVLLVSTEPVERDSDSTTSYSSAPRIMACKPGRWVDAPETAASEYSWTITQPSRVVA